MGIGRKVASVASAIVLAAASLVAVNQSAFGAAGVTATSVDEGQATTITITGCGDASLYAGASVVINNADGTVWSQNVATAGKTTTTVSWTAPVADAYGVHVTCHSYAADDSTAAASFLVYPTSLYLSGPDNASSWNAGDEVTVHGYGFQPHETVTLQMIDKSTNLVVWDAAAAAADAEGVFTSSFVLESDVPEGTYLLVAVGDESAAERAAEFYWGSPDGEPVEDTSAGGGEESAGGNDTTPKPAVELALPHTGH